MDEAGGGMKLTTVVVQLKMSGSTSTVPSAFVLCTGTTLRLSNECNLLP